MSSGWPRRPRGILAIIAAVTAALNEGFRQREARETLAQCVAAALAGRVDGHRLDWLYDEFSTLKFLGQELQARAQSIRFQKAA